MTFRNERESWIDRGFSIVIQAPLLEQSGGSYIIRGHMSFSDIAEYGLAYLDFSDEGK